MEKSDQIGLAKRLLNHVEQRTTDMADALRIQSVEGYTSPQWLAREKAAIFKKFPLFAGFGSDVPNPGDYKADNFAGTPVLLVRGEDGILRAFLNSCSHRAAPIAEGCGSDARGFVCPYHAWVYSATGALVRMPGKDGFAGLNKAEFGLKRLPLREKHGLIWLSLTPGAEFEVDDHLDAFARDFAAYGYAPYQHYHRTELTRRMNWKLVMDTFLENYHLSTLHRATIGDKIQSYVQLADTAGTNLRVIQARKGYADIRNQPESEWDFLKRTAIAYLLFPNTLFIHQSDHVEIWRSYPDGDDPDASIIHFDVYIPEPAATEKARRYWDRNIEYGISIVLGEDFVLGEKCQAAFHERDAVIYGRNESGLIHYHSVVERVLKEADGAAGVIRPMRLATAQGSGDAVRVAREWAPAQFADRPRD